ncbi:MAG TPA: acyltransferase family protein [Aldersonia sp.]
MNPPNRPDPDPKLVDAAPAPVSSRPHRHDLDGLRGLAIALVVIFHVWSGRVSGGVDVFLVLSGFFFTAMVLRRAGDTTRVPVRRILVRTARRLLPALVVVLTAIAAMTVATRPFTQWGATAEQVLASLLHVQNWQLARSAADYQVADASVSPMQHLWSMSVQAQFYLVAIALVAVVALACRRVGRPDRLAAVGAVAIFVLGAASFRYAAEETQTNQAWAYYDTAARLWETLAGALLAVVVTRVLLAGWARTVLAVTGLAAILSCGFLIDGARLFPGPAALVPVLATVALILAGTGGGPMPAVSRLLARPALVWLGSIAYGLYLWHWPVLIFYLSWQERLTAGIAGGVVVLGVSVALAWATYVWVETPLRESTLRESTLRERSVPVSPARAGRVAGVLVGTAAAVVVAASGGWQWYLAQNPVRAEALDPDVYPGAARLTDGAFTPRAPMRPTVLEAPHDLPPSSYDGCISDMSNREVIACSYGDETAERTLAVVGSSHAEHWLTALDVIGKIRGVRIASYLKMGCPLNLGEPMLGDSPYPDCRDWTVDVLDRLRADRPDWVFSTATRPNPSGLGDVTPDEYLQVWARYADFGLPFLGMRDTPWLHRDGVPYLAIDCLAAGGDAESCGIAREEVLSLDNPTLAAAADFPLVYPIDLSDAVCDMTICRVVEGNVLVYNDAHHLSATYVRSLALELDRQIGTTTGWW